MTASYKTPENPEPRGAYAGKTPMAACNHTEQSVLRRLHFKYWDYI
ncbi:MAG: hypothetical protein LUF26_07815 [Firmicutes bacterium]|nr:hypothetical protein [Bacillota bacterium]